MRPPLRNERGAALVVAILVLLLVAVLASILVINSTVETRLSGIDQRRAKALDLAEAGVSEAMARIKSVEIPNKLNPRMVAQIFLTIPGSVPELGTDSTGLATAQPAGNWLAYSTPERSPAALTVEYKTDAARSVVYRYDSTKNPPIQTVTGAPIYRVTSTGTVGNVSRTVVAEVCWTPIPFNIKGGFAAGQDVKFLGNAMSCGFNHRADTPTGTGFSGRAGSGGCNENAGASPPHWEWPGGSITGIWSTANGNGGGAANANGTPPTSNYNPTFYAGPWEALGMTQSEFYAWVGPRIGSLPGTPNGIYYLDHDATNQNASGEFDLVTGQGFIYCDGDLNLHANWRGLIYVEGDLKLNSASWMLGAVICKGKGEVKFNGGATILYSADALQQYVGAGGKVAMLSWHEM